MINTDYFKNKKVTVVGLGRSGFASCSLLYDLGAKVSVTDISQNHKTQDYADRLKKSPQIEVELGRHSLEFIKDRDLIVVSPGVDNNSSSLIWAQDLRIPIISEVELAWLLCPGTVIAVTGTNGKTTVTALIGRVIEAWGRRVHICGNIGEPFASRVNFIGQSDFVSLEVSSFQLERIDKFRPKFAIILNFSCNHLDRYANLEEYLEAKKRIFRNQDKSDFLVLNFNDPVIRDLAKESSATVVYFNKSGALSPNHSAVFAVADLLGIDGKIVSTVLSDFKGVEHRLEYVGKWGGVEFVNDSKATTVESTIWALNNIDKPVILIAGGRDKGLDFTLIKDLIREKVKTLILMGEARKKIKTALEGATSIQQTETLKGALDIAWKNAREGDAILLSPMCASFDMFANFEERGNYFKQEVSDLISKLK